MDCAEDWKYDGGSEKGRTAPGWRGSPGKASGKWALRPSVGKAGAMGPPGASCRALRMARRGFLPSWLCCGSVASDGVQSCCFLPVDTVLVLRLVSGFPVVMFPVLSSGACQALCDRELKRVGRSAPRWAWSAVGNRAVGPNLGGSTLLSLRFLLGGRKSQKVVARGGV